MIRPATERDLSRILEIERSSFPNPWPESLLRGHLGEGGFLVYERDGLVVGYVIAGIRIPSFWERWEKRTRAWMGQAVDCEERTGHIMNLAVDPAFRRQGLGEELLCQALEYLKGLGADQVELEVRVHNESAVQLYKKHGFQIQGRLPDYYRDSEDAYLMVRQL